MDFETAVPTASAPTTTTVRDAVRPYPMDNDNPHSVVQHSSLASLLDPVTTERIEGLRDLTGARCLEVGAGGGSIAVWLADRVGPTGSVLATDLKPHQIPQRPRLTVLRHDLLTEPIPPGPFDLIHARLVLVHLPQRLEILHRLTQSLAEGGVILIEDWDSSKTGSSITAPSADAAALHTRYRQAIRQVYTTHGTDPTWGSRIHGAMLAEGLVDVETTVTARSWAGGSPGCDLLASNLGHMRDDLLAAGLTEQDLVDMGSIFADPGFVVSGFLMHSTSGRRRRS